MAHARSFCAVLAVAAFLIAGALGAQPTPNTADSSSLLVVLDASGSMWGRLGDEPKIVVARRVLADLATDLPDTARVGVVAYGHNREGDCDDVETVLPLGPLDRQHLKTTVDGLNPKGKTPITKALGEAFEVVEADGRPTTVVLISDGLETCDGDPCKAVRTARASGIPLLLHVVGFDVADEDVSSLECAAQAGGGSYFDARDGEGLLVALDRAVEPEVTPTARLVVGAKVDGDFADVTVRVTDAEGQEVAIGRTYKSAETNPRTLPLPAGTYRATIKPIGIKAATGETFEFELADGETVEKHVEYGSGDFVLRVRQNGEPTDTVARVYRAGTNEEVAIRRTYKKPEIVIPLANGSYDVSVKSVKIKGAEPIRLEGVEIVSNGKVERDVAFETGTLKVEVRVDGGLGDATVYVYGVPAKGAVAQARVGQDPKRNPRDFLVLAGEYRVDVKAKTASGSQRQSLTATVEPGAEASLVATFESDAAGDG